MRITDRLSGGVVEVSASDIISIREYPAGQTQVSVRDPAIGVIDATESVEELARRKREEEAMR